MSIAMSISWTLGRLHGDADVQVLSIGVIHRWLWTNWYARNLRNGRLCGLCALQRGTAREGEGHHST